MLKLEKNSHNNRLTVKFQKRPRLFDRPLLFALAIALVIHIISILIFSIAPLKFNFPDHLPTPIAVEADAFPSKNNNQEYSAYTELEQRKLAKRSLIEPAKTEMTLPKLRQQPIDPPLDILDTITLEDHFDMQSQLLIDHHSLISFSVPKISVDIFGPLANRTILFTGAAEKDPLLQATADTLVQERLTFEVAMDPQEGQIVWFMAQENHAPKKIIEKAESILKNMRFKKTNSGGMTHGLVEITFNQLKN